MKGKRSAKQFYTKLAFVHRFHYQCSEMSSAKEIEGVYKSAIDRQNRLVKAGILDEICCVFLDEAGTVELRCDGLAFGDVLFLIWRASSR